ncbi:MAG: outer membrane beta-barrel protein [Pedobacter sp.]|nr:outer membrane beta-barrel protein [Pedobacter sp.]
MKKTTKILASAVAAIAIFFSVNANAQDTRKFGIGLNAGFPTNDGYSFAIGGDLRYQFDVSKQLSIPITAGFTSIQGEDVTIGTTTISYRYNYVPVKAGLKYFFNDSGAGVYGLAEAGAAFGTDSGAGTEFVFSPAIGYAWSNGLDLAAKYEGIPANGGTLGYVGIRLAYGFKL